MNNLFALALLAVIASSIKVQPVKTSGDKIEPEKTAIVQEAEKESSAKTPLELGSVNPNIIYYGIIDQEVERRGKDYYIVNAMENGEIELQKKKATLELEKGSAIFIKISKKGTVSLKRELKITDLDNAFVVEAIEDGCAIIKGEDGIIDFEASNFNSSKGNYELDDYKYYLIDASSDKSKIEFKSIEEIPYKNVSLKRDDRIIFDSKIDMAFIVRGL